MYIDLAVADPGFSQGGGPLSCEVPCRRDSVGVVAEFFRDLKKPVRFSGGGGVVAEIFRGLQKPGDSVGGG